MSEQAAEQAKSGNVILVKFEDLINTQSHFSKLISLKITNGKSIKRLVKIGLQIKSQLEIFEMAKKDLIKNLDGEITESLNSYAFAKENRAKWDKEFNGLLNETVTLNGTKFQVEDISPITDDPNLIIALSWLVDADAWLESE